MTGRVFDIQRFSTHDGPGIRTTVFFKGCPLRCTWCHNPEGIEPRPHLSWDREKCAGCGRCVAACRREARKMLNDSGRPLCPPDRQRCIACGECVPGCATGASELVGRSLTLSQVMDEVLADRAFYEQTSGGMTLSGGEPLSQPEFAVALLEAAKREGLHCCIETCGFAAWDAISRVLPLTDLFLYDWKATDPAVHEKHTGQSNHIIRRNLCDLYRMGAKVRLQCPIIPGCNDTEEHFKGIAGLADAMPEIEVNILPYHPLGTSKLDRFGWSAAAVICPKNSARQTAMEWKDRLASQGVRLAGGGGTRQEEIANGNAQENRRKYATQVPNR